MCILLSLHIDNSFTFTSSYEVFYNYSYTKLITYHIMHYSIMNHL